MADNDEWAYYFAALRGVFGPIKESEPQTGYYRHYTGAAVAIWREDGTVILLLDAEQVIDHVDQGRIWLSVAKKPVSHDHYILKTTTGMWPGLPDSLAAKVVAADRVTETAGAIPGPGHNSADLSTFRAMRAEITEKISESAAFYARHQINNQDDANRAQDWGDDIAKAAVAADKARLAETAPLREQIDEINARWNGLIKPAQAQATELRDLAQQWGRAEAARRRKEAEDEAARQWQKQQDDLRVQREEEAKRRAAEKPDTDGVLPDDLGFDLPPAAPPPKPVVQAPKVVLGTGTVGNRRSVKTSPTKVARIADLKAAALYLAEQENTDLVALVQRLADKAAKAGLPMPGVVFADKEEAA